MRFGFSHFGLLLAPLFVLTLPVSPQVAPESREERSQRSSWDAAYLAERPPFNQEPNAFLVEIAKGLEPGDGLDVGMGQGRNALFLAGQGWNVTGFDVSEVGVAQAKEHAEKFGLKLDALVQSSEDFGWGDDRWDLIVLTYFPQLRRSLAKIVESLRPGGVVVVEAYHKDAALDRPPGPGAGVTFDSNELLKLFAEFRILRYQDIRAKADWGLFETRLVRLLAQKHP